jgi:hypothetical protein
MPRVEPLPRRSIPNVEPGRFRLEIPARRNWLAILFLGAWLVFWAFGEVAVTRMILLGAGAPRLFMFAWLVLWTVGGGHAIVVLAWGIAGREIVTLGGGVLLIRRGALGVGRTWEYGLETVRNLRVDPARVTYSRMESTFPSTGLSGGPVAFDHGARTVRFAGGVDEAEAAIIVKELGERLG